MARQVDLLWFGLGAEPEKSPEEAGYVAFAKEAEKRDYGTSDEDLKAYGTAAGAAAGAAGCIAVGAAAAAPLCGIVGGEIGGAIVEFFTTSAEEEAKRHREQALAWKVWEEEIKRVGGSFWTQGKFDDSLFHKISSQIVSNYQKSISDTGIILDQDKLFRGQGGPNGSIAWRMLEFGWGQRFKKYPGWYPTGQEAVGWGKAATQAEKDAISMKPVFDHMRDSYTKWILQGFNSATFDPNKSASVNAGHVTGYTWQKVVGERFETAINEFSKAFAAGATPQTAQAAAIRAQRKQAPVQKTSPVVYAGAAIAAGWVLWEFLL